MPEDARSFALFGFPIARVDSPRTRRIARLFNVAAVSREPAESCAATPPIELPEPGRLFLLTGPSGAGKSTLLRQLIRSARRAGRADRAQVAVIDVQKLKLPRRAVANCFPRRSLESTLRLLARVGLGEVWLWLGRAEHLSEGQRFRLRLAICLDRAERSRSPTLLVCDEFAATLDRVTACVVAHTLGRAIRAMPQSLAAVVATSHDDLEQALDADRVVRCDFGFATATLKLGKQTRTDNCAAIPAAT